MNLLNKPRALFAVLYTALVVTYYLSPPVTGWVSPSFTACLALAVAWAAAGVVLNPGRRNLPWALLFAGLVLNLLGNGVSLGYLRIAGAVPYPSASDALELSSYLFFFAGLALLSRFWFKPRAVVIALGAAALVFAGFSWPFLIRPVAASSELSFFAKFVTIAYPAADVILLFQVVLLASVAVAVSRLHKRVRISPEFWLIAAGAIGFLLSDSVFAYAAVRWNWSQPSVADLGWLTWFGTWALAFLGPQRDASVRQWYLTGKNRVH